MKPKSVHSANPLYIVLFDNLPEFRDGDQLNIKKLSHALDATYQGIFNYFKASKVPLPRALQLCKLSGSLLTVEKMKPFITGWDE